MKRMKEELVLLKAMKEAEEYRKMNLEEKKEYERKTSLFTIKKGESTFSALASLF